tara:strand:- start:3463 stop:4515 length:1053 start_codon:yes stop_codon:yes gene_type:complete
MIGNYKNFKGAILIKQNQPLVVEEINLPDSLDVGQVLVKVHVSGICGSQIGEITGAKGNDPYLPHLLGHEGCGTVLEIGPGVSHVEPNDLVVLHWRQGAGIQARPPKYLLEGNQINAGWITTFNSHAVVSENRCTKIPSGTDPELAAMFGCAITTGFGVVENNARVRLGESVVVFGAGGIGLNIIQAASLSSAWPIIAIDLFDNRLELAKKIGATHVINSSSQNVDQEIKTILDQRKLDVFIDNTGIPDVIELGYRLTHSEGKVILVGVPRKENDIRIHSLPLHFGKIIQGSHGGECQPEKDIARYLNIFNNGLGDIQSLITSRFSLSDINEAIDCMRSGKTSGRVLIET